MLESYLVLGGNEVVNAGRSFGYAATVDCRATWLKDPECDTLAEAQQDAPYEYANIADAPWYDPDVPESNRFLGAYGLSISNLSDSTREAAITQKTGPGAKTTGYRHGSREMRVRAWLTAAGDDAMEYGMTWLRNVLEPDACGLHGGACGEAEMGLFVDCPPTRRLVPEYTDWDLLATNLITNPSFETTSGAPELRRNVVPNPEAASTTNLWGAGSANTGGITSIARVATTGPRVGTAMVRKTWTTGESAAGTSATLDVSATSAADAYAVSPNTAYIASIYVRSSNAENLRLDAIQYDIGGVVTGNNSGAASVMTAGQWSRIQISFTTAATTTKVRLVIRQSASLQHIASSTWDATMALLETGSTLLPYFSGSNMPRLRENRVPNPRALSTGSTWGTVSGGANTFITDFPGDVNTAIRWTSSGAGAAARPVAILTGAETPDLGEAAHVYLRVRVQGGTLSGVTVAVRPVVTSASNQTSISIPDLTPGDHIIDVVTPATAAGIAAGASSGVVLVGTPSAIGMTIDATAAVVEVGSTGGFFDGATVEPGFTYTWVGTAAASGSYQTNADLSVLWFGSLNGSASLLRGVGATGYTNGLNAVGYTSVRWVGGGTKSLAIEAKGGSPDSAIDVTPAIGALMSPDNTYTFVGTVHLEKPLTSPHDDFSLRLRVNGTGITINDIVVAPNAPGTYEVRQSITLDASAVVGTAYLYNGAQGNGETVWWDNIMLIDGSYGGDAFDGSTLDDDYSRYTWTGAANASSSTLETRTSYDVPEPDSTYFPYVDPSRRYLHSVRCVSGPFTVEKRESNNGKYLGRLVEFTLVAEVPFMFGKPRELEIPPIVPSVVQDIAYNLAPYPSAELAGTAMVAAQNFSTNPSVETNNSGWGTVSGGGTSGMTTSGRVTGELAAVGTSSFRTVFTATGASGGTAGFIGNWQEVALGGGAGARYSVNIWSAAVVMAGTPVLGANMNVYAYWRSSAGGTTLRTDVLGTIPTAGGALSVKSLLPPAGATHVSIEVQQPIPTFAAGNIVRLYSDALAVTTP